MGCGEGEAHAPASNPRRPVVMRSPALLVIPAWFMRVDTPGSSPPVSNTVPARSMSGHLQVNVVAWNWSQPDERPKPYDHIR